MKKAIWIFLGLVLINSCKKSQALHPVSCTYSGVEYNNTNHPKHNVLTNLIKKYQYKGLPGISILIEDKDGKWSSSTGFADIEEQTAMEMCHVSKVASITKFFMGVLVHKLIEDGAKFTLDDKINKYIPSDITDKIENANDVTLRMLMNHTTGIYDIITDSDFYLAVLNNPNKVWNQESLLKYVYGKKAYFKAGTKANYSNTNTLLVSLFIDKAMRESHGKLLHDKILGPLGLSDTYYHSYDELPNNTAQGYFDLYNNGSQVNVSNLMTGNGNGYNGIYTTCMDMEKFIRAVLIDKTFLSTRSLDNMQIFGMAEGVNEYGAGIVRKFIDRGADFGLGHAGRDLGYSADLFYFPNKEVTISFMVNYGTDGNSALKEVFEDFEQDLLDVMLK